MQDVLFALNEVRRVLWEIVENGPAHKLGDKIRALHEIKDLEFRCLEAAQSMGEVHKEPLKVNWQERQERAERLHQRVTEISKGDADLADQIVRLIFDLSKSDN